MLMALKSGTADNPSNGRIPLKTRTQELVASTGIICHCLLCVQERLDFLCTDRSSIYVFDTAGYDLRLSTLSPHPLSGETTFSQPEVTQSMFKSVPLRDSQFRKGHLRPSDIAKQTLPETSKNDTQGTFYEESGNLAIIQDEKNIPW